MFREKYHLEFVQLIYYITHNYSESVTLGKENIFFILTKKMFSWQITFHCWRVSCTLLYFQLNLKIIHFHFISPKSSAFSLNLKYSPLAVCTCAGPGPGQPPVSLTPNLSRVPSSQPSVQSVQARCGELWSQHQHDIL